MHASITGLVVKEHIIRSKTMQHSTCATYQDILDIIPPSCPLCLFAWVFNVIQCFIQSTSSLDMCHTHNYPSNITHPELPEVAAWLWSLDWLSLCMQAAAEQWMRQLVLTMKSTSLHWLDLAP